VWCFPRDFATFKIAAEEGQAPGPWRAGKGLNGWDGCWGRGGIVGWFRRVFVRAMIQAVGGAVLKGEK